MLGVAWTAPDGSGLLMLDASSIQTAPDESRRILGMIKAHWILYRMPSPWRQMRLPSPLL
jgi:hypothetical protein